MTQYASYIYVWLMITYVQSTWLQLCAHCMWGSTFCSSREGTSCSYTVARTTRLYKLKQVDVVDTFSAKTVKSEPSLSCQNADQSRPCPGV
jgi:hypothetical protein